jgi:hypothetical protein
MSSVEQQQVGELCNERDRQRGLHSIVTIPQTQTQPSPPPGPVTVATELTGPSHGMGPSQGYGVGAVMLQRTPTSQSNASTYSNNRNL